jgi:hypothetical protein
MNMQWKNLGLVAALLVLPLSVPTVLAQQDEDPPEVAARIALLEGNVSLQVNGADDWSVPQTNYPLTSGDRLYTDTDGRVAIQQGSVDVRVWHSTDVTLTNLTSEYEQIGLASGSMRVRVFSLDTGRTVEVDTPNGAVIIQRPGDYRIDAYGGDDGSLVEVNSGAVQITGPNVNQEVDAGQAVQLYGTDQIQVGLVDMLPFNDLDNWSISRDHHILASQSARYVSREIPGYDDLDDNGGWEQGQYGAVWYPRDEQPGWAPYTYGHWAYVQPWGYTWIDDASWGYAPFHYGRWVHEGPRWGWVPGPVSVRPVYSPALVAFVGGGPGLSVGFGGGGVAAWFTLSIGEPYVPWYRCSPRYVERNNVSNVNITNIHNTTIINNYNTFITNTRTVTTVNNIRVNNVTYVNRTNVVAVPVNTMASGGRVSTAAVRLSPQQQQTLARAPIAAPAQAPVPPPVRPVMVQARAVAARPVARPVLMTPRGAVVATPAKNAPIARSMNLPKPQPAAAIQPATHAAPGLTVQGRSVARPVAVTAPAVGGAARPTPNQPPTLNRPATATPTTPAPVMARPVTPVARPLPSTPPNATQPVTTPGAAPNANRPLPPPYSRPTPTTPPEAARPALQPPPASRPLPPSNTRPALPPPATESRPLPPTNTRPALTTPPYTPNPNPNRPAVTPPPTNTRPASPPPTYAPNPNVSRPSTPPPPNAERPLPPANRSTPPPPTMPRPAPPVTNSRPAPNPPPNVSRPAPNARPTQPPPSKPEAKPKPKSDEKPQ